jgi:DNA ligase-4
LEAQLAKNLVRFAGGQTADQEEEEGVTHVVVPNGETALGTKVTDLARIVGVSWIQKCWDEGTIMDEERYQWGWTWQSLAVPKNLH